MKKLLIIGGITACLAVASGYYFYDRFFAPTDSEIPQNVLNKEELSSISTLAENLDTPWSIHELPDSRILFTERGGTISVIGANKQTFTIADVIERGEGGLLGLAIDPDFSNNSFIYIYKTTTNGNIVERYRFSGSELTDRKDILTNIPAATNHNGGAISFGPDGKLYITTGDAQVEQLAQDRSNLAGKILRINADGSIPSDNPFNNAVWSYGHRNPQGIAWDSQGRLWSTEHGPSGPQSGNDELNLIQKGGNYGWPLVRGNQTRDGMIPPVAESGTSDTWAPASLVYTNGHLYFTGLRSQTLYKARINGEKVDLTRHLSKEYGRLRALHVQENTLLVGTSNKDGRGRPSQNDDKILKVPLQLL